MTIPLVNGVNPLQTTLLELGIVSSRVALLLRSAEIQPVFGRFVTEWFIHSPPPTVQNLLQGRQLCCTVSQALCGSLADPVANCAF